MQGSWQRGGSALSSPRTPRHEGITTQCAILTAFAAALQTPVAASVLSINLTPPNPVIPAGAALKPAVSNDRPSTATASNAPFTEALMQAALLHHVQPAVQWEACCALRMLCSAPVPVQRPAWPSISSLVNAHLQRVLEATSRSNAKAGGGNGGTSASLPEKVLNQAVRLAGDWMRALLLDSRTPDVCPAALESSPGSVEASVRVTGSSSKHHGPDSEVSVAATGFVQLMVQCAAQAGVPVLRSAAFAAIAAAPPVLWVVLEQQQLEQLVVRLCSAAKTDGVPSTRAQAINALKSIVDDISSVAALGTELDGVACALAEGCSDASASVRGASAAALAALCTTLRDTVHSVDPDGVVKSSEEEHADPVALEKHAILNTMAQPRDGAVAKIDVNVARSEGNVRDGVVIGDSQSSQIVGATLHAQKCTECLQHHRHPAATTVLAVSLPLFDTLMLCYAEIHLRPQTRRGAVQLVGMLLERCCKHRAGELFLQQRCMLQEGETRSVPMECVQQDACYLCCPRRTLTFFQRSFTKMLPCARVLMDITSVWQQG